MSNEIKFNTSPVGANGFVEMGEDEGQVDMTENKQFNTDSTYSRITPSDVSNFAEQTNSKIASWGKSWHEFKTGSPNLSRNGEIGIGTLEAVGRGAFALAARGLNMATGALDVAEGFYLDREFGSGSGVGKKFAVALGKSMVGIGAGMGTALILGGAVTAPVLLAGLALSAAIKFGLDAATA